MSVEVAPEIAEQRSTYDMEVQRDPTFNELVKANFENNNLIYNVSQALGRDRAPADPTFDVMEYIKSVGDEGHAQDYIGSENAVDAEYIHQRLAQKNENMATMAAGGYEGIAAGFAAGLVDPLMYVPIGGSVVKTYQTGGRILEGAAHTALMTGLTVAGSEVALQDLQPGRTGEESMGNIATATLVGGVLGGVAGAMAPKEIAAAVKGADDHMNQFGSSEYFADVGAMQTDRTTLEGQKIADTIGLKSFREPVLSYLQKNNAPQWTQTLASKFLKNADEVMAFQDPVARMNNSPSKVTTQMNERLNETPLVRNKNTQEFDFRSSVRPVQNKIQDWLAPKVQMYDKIDKAFLDYRGAKSKMLTIASDAMGAAKDKLTGTAREDGMLTHYEFGREVMKAWHNGGEHEIPQVAATAKKVSDFANAHFDEAHAVGLVDDETYKNAKAAGPYAPHLWDSHAIKADRPGITAKIKEHLVNKRDAAASRVKDTLDKFNLKDGDIGELFKREKASLRDAQGETRAAKRKVDASGNAVENKTISIDQVQSRLDELTSSQERIYSKILNGRDRGEDDLSDLFNEFKSTSSRKRELYRQMMAREGEEDIATAKLTRRQEMVDKLTEHENNLEKRVAEFENTLKDLTLDKYKAGFHDEDLDNVAYQIVDRILGTSIGRLAYDNKLDGISSGAVAGKRGSLKARKFDMPYSLAKDYLVHDLHSNIEAYTRSIVPDIELFREFGTLDTKEAGKAIQDDYAQLMSGVTDKDVAKKLTKLQSNDLRDFDGTFRRLRGTFDNSDDYGSGLKVANRMAMALNYMSSLGGMTISAFADVARPVMVHGINRVYGDGLKVLATDFAGFKMAAKEMSEAGAALDIALQTTARRRLGYDEYAPMVNKAESVLGTMTSAFTMGTLMPVWNDGMKTFAGVVTQNRMLKTILGAAAGKEVPAKEMQYLAENYMGKETGMINRVANQFAKYGDPRKDINVPNVRNWDDVDAAKIFRGAIRREVDKIIVTPGQDKPLWMSKTGLNLIGQFRSFSVASTQRTMLTAMQQKDMAVLNGVAMTVGLGAMIYIIKSKQAGIEPNLSVGNLITEGVDRGGLTGWLMDANNIAEKLSRSNVGVRPMLGAPSSSRYASRSAAEALLGPTYGRIMNGIQVTGDAAAGDLRPADISMMRRMIPFQNLIGVRSLFDQAQKNIEEALPEPDKSK